MDIQLDKHQPKETDTAPHTVLTARPPDSPRKDKIGRTRLTSSWVISDLRAMICFTSDRSSSLARPVQNLWNCACLFECFTS